MRARARTSGQFRRSILLSCCAPAWVLWPAIPALAGCSALRLDANGQSAVGSDAVGSVATASTAPPLAGTAPFAAAALPGRASPEVTASPVATSDSAKSKLATSAKLNQLLPAPLWKAGGGLVARPTLGSDGSLYVASRQAVLDVINPSGEHRFTITLGAAPSGEIYVDERGWAFLGLNIGAVIGVTAEGQKFFTFQAPKGVRGDLTFAEGQGLLFSGSDGVVIGLNRGGYPTMRMNVHARLTAGPVGISGWCVVATSGGDIEWGNRWGKRHRLALGGEVQALLPTAANGLWALLGRKLVSIAAGRSIAFERSNVLGVATASRALRDRGIEGISLTEDDQLQWLDPAGNAVKTLELGSAGPVRASQVQILTLDDDGGVWGTTVDGRVLVWHPGEVAQEIGALPGTAVFAPAVDAARRRVVIAAVSGEIYGVGWPDSVRAWQ